MAAKRLLQVPEPKDRTAYPWRARVTGLICYVYFSSKPRYDDDISLCMGRFVNVRAPLPKFNVFPRKGSSFGRIFAIDRNPHYRKP